MTQMKTIAGLLVGTGAALFSGDALACGGFFCSQVPVLQTAERIVFEVEGDTVTAYVQLQFSGDDPNFAWIVPVPETPTVEVGVGQEMFDALEEQTKPVFISQDAAGQPQAFASVAPSGCGGGGFGPSFSGDPRVQTELLPPPEVTVWQAERVGPFDVTTLSADKAEDLNNWLRINNYRVQPGSEPIVQGYLDDGMKLLALKLSPETGSTGVEPVKLTYEDSRGCAMVPLKLTAIASTPGLEIVTWIFGDSRAEPSNFGSVVLDTTNVLSPADYVPAIGAQVDEQADGRGFVTEMAQPTANLSARGDAVLDELLMKHAYVTRLRTFIDPSEMTEDPEFRTDRTLPDVSNEVVLGGRPPFEASGVGGLVLLAVVLVARRRRS